MYRKIASKINYPAQWAGSADKPSRWRRLDQLDRMLDGTFYDHLQHSFYEETRRNGDELIPLEERRPSSQYHLPRMVARWSARKLWAGRHVPRIHHKDTSVTEVVDQLIQTTQFFSVMMNATILGSVGSVAVTFRVDRTQDEPQVGFRVWQSKDCAPTFDDFNNLVALRVFYTVMGAHLLAAGFTVSADGQAISKDQQYWWMRIFDVFQETTLVPARVEDWNPVQGWVKPGLRDVPFSQIAHGLTFVPGVWVRNLNGCLGIDGVGTWDDAKDISVEIDYLLSQASRGTRYNCAPELVIVGDMQDTAGEVARSPASFIHLRSGTKDQDGLSVTEGSASLLEMTGNGIKAAQELIDKLRNMALEQIGATRKDPEKLKGVMSGRAMEFLDEDSHDLVMELRSSYGFGALELFRKVVRAIDGDSGDPRGLKLDWPRLYQPTPEDLAHLIPALVLAATPIQAPLEPEEAMALSGGGGDDDGDDGGDHTRTAETRTNKSASGASTTVKKEVEKGPGTQGGRPSVAPTGGKNIGALLEVEQASAYLKIHMDIDLLPDESNEGVTDSDEPRPVAPPPERQPGAPEESDGGVDIEIPRSP